jgi:hypothetical protein
MTDQERTKELIIYLSIALGGLTLSFIFAEHVKYAGAIFLCFPLGLYFLLRKTASFSFAVPLSLIQRLIFGFALIGLGIYGILYVHNIVQ